MVKYTIERLLLAILTTCIILTMTFFLMKLLPFSKPIGEDSAKFTYYLNQVSLGYVLDFKGETGGLGELLWNYQDTSGAWHYFYLRPSGEQYIAWVTGIFNGFNWGPSTFIQANVDSLVLIRDRLPYTIKVNVWEVVLSVPLGIALGIWAALKKNKMTDHIISTLVMIFISLPSFIIITFFMLIFCYKNNILPSQWPADSDPASRRALGYILPVLSLSFGSICGYCRFTRAELTEVMSSDFLLLARTKGLTKNQTIIRHALKNAMVPILPSILAEIIGVLGGSMILESLYGIPGVGSLYVTAIQRADYNVLLADMSFYTIIGLTAGVFLDLSYGFIDPRIRMGAKK